MRLASPQLKYLLPILGSLGLAASVWAATPASVVMPATAVGAASAAQSVTFSFTAAATVSSVRVLFLGAANLDFTADAGGTCAGTHAKNATCTVPVIFTPHGVGTRLGAVELIGSNGAALQTVFLSGIGQGAGANFSPSARTALGTYLDSPASLAFDAQGNLYVGDFPASTGVGGRVVKIPLINGVLSTASQTEVDNPAGGPALACPGGLAFDGAGNLYDADNCDSEVIEMPADGSANVIVTSSLNGPAGLAVDGAGNLFIADQANNRVLELPNRNGKLNANAAITLGSKTDPLMGPDDVAFDSDGNLIVADYYNARVVKIPLQLGTLNSAAQSTLVPNHGGQPAGLALDAANNLYIALQNPTAIEVVPYQEGTYNFSARYVLDQNFVYPDQVKVDGNGNVIYTDLGGAATYKLDTVDPAAMAFTETGVGQSTAAQSLPLLNTGNEPLSISSIAFATNFPNLGTTCTGTLAAGTACSVSVDFAPTAVGPQNGNTVIADNALNQSRAPQMVALAGTAVQGPQTIAFTPVAGLTYGGAPVVLAAIGGGSVNAVTFTVTSGPGKLDGASLTATGVGAITITANQAGDANYLAAPPATEVITAAPAILTVTANNSSVTYGGGLPSSFAYTITGFVDGDTNTVVQGAPSFSSNAAATSPVGTYAIVPGYGTLATANYNFVFVSGTLSITSARLSVNANDASTTFGILPVLNQYTLRGFVNGDGPNVVKGTPILSVAGLTTLSPVGSYPISVSVAGMSATNYTIVAGAGATLTVGKATPQTSWPLPGPTTLVYGGTLAGWLNVSSTVAGGWRLTYNGSDTGSTRIPDVGNQTLTAIFTPTDTTDYNGVVLNTFITVIPATLTVTANSATAVFGSALPALGYTITGFVAGNNASVVSGTPTLTTTAAAGSPPGAYTINVSTAGMNAGSAYTFVGVPGILTIQPAAPSAGLAAAGMGLTYGQPFGAGILTSNSVPGAWTFTANAANVTAASVLPAGSYAVVGTFTPTDARDFTIVTATLPGALSVAPAPLTITANNASMVSGSALPSFGFTATGLVNGDTQASALGGAPVETTTADSTSAAGTYPITISAGSLTASNYTLSFVNGTLTVTAASALPYSSATSLQRDFNFHPIKVGETLWFAASIDADAAQDGAILAFQHAVINFTVDGTPVSLNVPNGTVRFSAAATVASTSFDPVTQTWNTIAPLPNIGRVFHPGKPCPPGLGLERAAADAVSEACGSQQIFITGFALPMTTALRGNVDDVTWSGTLATNNPDLVAAWQWNATSYANFSSDNNALGVVAAPNSGPGGDPAGTPDNFERFVRPGGTLPGDADDRGAATVHFKN